MPSCSGREAVRSGDFRLLRGFGALNVSDEEDFWLSMGPFSSSGERCKALANRGDSWPSCGKGDGGFESERMRPLGREAECDLVGCDRRFVGVLLTGVLVRLGEREPDGAVVVRKRKVGCEFVRCRL